MRGKDTRACGGGHGAIQIVSSYGQCYVILARPKVEASNTVIIEIIPVCFRSISVLFDPR